jgi:hypothetical protein
MSDRLSPWFNSDFTSFKAFLSPSMSILNDDVDSVLAWLIDFVINVSCWTLNSFIEWLNLVSIRFNETENSFFKASIF